MLIDSNVIIYALNSSSPKNKTAQLFLSSQKNLIFAQQNIFESLRILTHAKFSTLFSVSQAIDAIEEITSQAKVISPVFETTQLALELAKKYKISGAQIFDTYLVATAITNGIKIIATDNIKDFKKYSEIKVVNPFKKTSSLT